MPEVFRVTDVKEIPFEITEDQLKDAFGNEATVDTVRWESTNPEIFELTQGEPSRTNLSGVGKVTGKAGPCVLSVVIDGDLGPGIRNSVGTKELFFQAGDVNVSGLNIVLGAPVPRDETAPAPEAPAAPV